MIILTFSYIIFLKVLIYAQVFNDSSNNGIYKSENHTLQCTPISEGYKCTLVTPSEQDYCRVYTEICSNKWMCIGLHNGFLCRRDAIPYGRHYKLWLDRQNTRTKRSSKSISCEEALCESEQICENGQCRCLKHYTGKYCYTEINYCTNHPCGHYIKCIPRLGDFTCDCQPHFAGKYCQHFVHQMTFNMKDPNFLFKSFPYIGFEYYYLFHAQYLGYQPKVEVDFGDGTILKGNFLSYPLTNAFNIIIKYFTYPLNIKSSQLEAYLFSHIYSTPDIYTVKVRAWNSYYEVFNTEYEVQVSAVPLCSLDVTLRNAAFDNTSPLQLYRENAINIMSAAWSNCLHMQLKYQWKIYKVKSFEEKLTTKNLYRPKKNIKLTNPSLEIPSFTLHYGSYTVILLVEMMQPKLGIKQQVATWFIIQQKPIIAHIEGGKSIWIHTKSMFYLDASMSYDPNYGKDKQPPLTFAWACHPKNTFCKGYYVLNETGSVLVVPANVLEEQKYTFTLWVNSAKNPKVNNYTGTTSQEVQGVSSMVSFYTIRCLQNCLGGRANSMEIIALRGICISDPLTEVEYKKNWIVFPNPDTNTDKGMRLDNVEFSADNYYIVLYEQQLQPGQEYKFVFSGYNTETSTDVRSRNASFAEFYITTYDIPGVENCTVDPLEGYGMLTTFSIVCVGFIPGGDAENESLLYEVTQFTNLQDRASSGAFIGYDYTSTISNLTLAPGFRHNDYVTTLVITAINNNGLSAALECNVTVLPLIYYFKDPVDVVQRFIHMGTGPTSPLNLLLTGGNYVELTQQIISTSFTFEQFLKSQDCKRMDPEFIHTSIETVQDNFMSYLHQVPVACIKSIKHLATALDKIVNLSPRHTEWKLSIIMGVGILKNLVNKLEKKIKVDNENILENDMDDIGIILVNIAASILKIPTTDSEVLREDIIDYINIFTRSSYVKKINPYSISSEVLAEHDSNIALNIINKFMRLYMAYKVPNERTTLISSPELSILMKKAAPEFLTTRSLSLSGKVSVRLLFNKNLFNKNAFCNLEMIVMDNNPNWYSYKYSFGNFPFVQINLTNEVDGSQVDADLEVYLRPINPELENVQNGSLPIVLFWKITEEHIQVHRIIVPKGGKLLIEFLPIKDKCKLQVVVKKKVRPTMIDFWHNAINIPQKVPKTARDKGLSIFVDDEANEKRNIYYLGVLPHMDTLKELLRSVEEPIFPHAFHYDDDEDLEEYYAANYLDNTPKIQRIEYGNNSDTHEVLPYSFTARSVQCVVWNETTKHWTSQCNVKASTTSSRVICNCTGHNPLTASFVRVSVRHQEFRELRFSIEFYENPLIIFLVVFTLVLFIGLFHWAAVEDRNDRLERTVCFLVDNYPQCEYCYLVIVYTGRIIKGGTTSNVTIEVEGTTATSLPHVLKDWSHAVLERGHQDWFVLKTTKPLGEIYCLHIWTDYSGSRPSWYCSKITIHDIQEQQLWFFNVEKWFDPIHGDGSMSYTIYQSTDRTIFSTAYHLRESVTREFDSGMHGWFSIFFKHPYSNFSRKQRVAVAYLHMIIMMVILILLNDVHVSSSAESQMYKTGYYTWEANDLVMAIYTVLIAFPIHNLFVWLFRCIKPSSQWTESILDEDLSRFNLDQTKSEAWIGSAPKVENPKIKTKDRKGMKKTVSFSSDFFEPEGQRKLRSRHSLEKLVKGAGDQKVVPLRTPMSKVETDIGFTEISLSNELNTPVYGREIITQSYCFPPGFIYAAWIILVCVTIPCIYITILYGISFGWVFSLHYLMMLFIAILISILIIEPLKLLGWSVYVFIYNRREYSVEDRSDLVETLNPQFVLPAFMHSHITEKINKLRQSDMYTPLDPLQVRKFKRNRLVTFITRMTIADFMLLVLFVLLLASIIDSVHDSHTFYHYRHVKELTAYSKLTRKSALVDVRTEEDLVHYLNDTLLTNLQFLDETKNQDNEYKDVNYLVGAIRLRQVRKSPKACRPHARKWAARCDMIFDRTNYKEGWTKAKANHEYRLSPNITEQSWLFRKRLRQFRNLFLYRNESKYPPSVYETILGETKTDAMLDLEYLAKHKWFDYLTTAVYTDFALYNPNKHCLSVISIMAERTQQGVYYVYPNIGIIKMSAVETSGQLLVLIFLFASFAWLTIYINKESKKYSMVKPADNFSSRWNQMRKAVLILGVINIAIYIHKSFLMDSYEKQIAKTGNRNFIDFGSLYFWDQCLQILIAFMFFLVIIDLFHIFNSFYKVKLFLTVLSKSETKILAFLSFLVVLIMGFATSGYLLFGQDSYSFHSFTYAFYTIFAFTHRNFKVTQFGRFDQMSFITSMYYIALILLIFFIFRWLMATIIIHSHYAVKSNAQSGLYQPVLSNYTKKYLDKIESNPNRKHIKRARYLQKFEYRIRALGCLFVDFYNKLKEKKEGTEMSKARRLAMDYIALDVLKKYKPENPETHDSDAEQYRRKEQAKALVRTIIFMNTLNNRLAYLNAKLDILIREERYRSIIGNKKTVM